MGSKMDYRVALDTNGKVNAAYMGAYNVRGIPHAFIVGKDGKVSWHDHPMQSSFEVEIQKAVNVPNKISIDYKGMNEEELSKLGVGQLKEILKSNGVDYSGCVEKEDLVQLVRSKC
eukprot:TRINITY_DN1835_c0_g1_i1.p1 TRINITY_DN1835_c0_g1~~TRINITY_DN1835_c0_g1_i1.p1  ORF type:complete len:116 (-),score=51.96 TRINITY_DN1835_c0_g1_i1:26-373(-)